MRQAFPFIFGAWAALAGPAVAADLAVHAAPTPAEVVWPWGGLYAGISGGPVWGRSGTTLSVSSTTLALFPPIIPAVNAAGTNVFAVNGGSVQATAGYNYQATPLFVLGLEGDIGWMGLRGSANTANAIPILGGIFTIAQQIRTDWQGSLRGRLGVVAFDKALLYATGGLAVTNVRHTSAFVDAFFETEYAAANQTRAGWTIGAGVEAFLTPNWSMKLEYLHAEYPGVRAIGYSVLVDGTIATAEHRTTTLRTDSVRLGLNYHFATPVPAPVIAKY